MYFLQEVNDLLFGERDVTANKGSQTSNDTDRVLPMGTRRMTDFQKIPVLSPILDKDTSYISRTHSNLHSLIKNTNTLDTHFASPNLDILLLRVDSDTD